MLKDLLWKKLVFQAASGCVSALLKKSNTEILASEAAKEMARLCFREALAVLEAKTGIHAESERLESEFLEFLKNSGSEEPAKIGVQLARILKDAKRFKIQTPVLEKIHALARAYEEN